MAGAFLNVSSSIQERIFVTKPFVHLHLHTEYSIVDSTVRIPALMNKAASSAMPAVAMTDQGNMLSLIHISEPTRP